MTFFAFRAPLAPATLARSAAVNNQICLFIASMLHPNQPVQSGMRAAS